jgi:hypothetical protein
MDVAARRMTTELRHVLHEHDVTLIARVVVYERSNVGRVEAMICWGSNEFGPSSTAVFDVNDDGVTSVAVETVEDGVGVAATAAFERGPEGDGATRPLAVVVTEPAGVLSLVVRLATGG